MTRELKWGYFGPRGTFTEQAARKLRDQLRDDQDVSISLIPYVTIPDVLKDVEKGTIDGGIVPIENSTEGSVNVTLDSLAHDANVFIVNELILPIRHHLLAKH